VFSTIATILIHFTHLYKINNNVRLLFIAWVIYYLVYYIVIEKMTNLQKRFVMFLFGCILTRFIFVWVAKNIPLTYLPYLGVLALGPVIGWIWIIFIGKRDTGAEVFGEKIWWKDVRIVHLGLYLAFAIMAFQKLSYAWIALLVDVLFGLISWIIHHYYVGSFSKLF